ncbi:MAG: tol-pal system protein YbgF [Kiloniellales bacterium]|nr:tol-pal system protein YbgF [Kiloniellales bacterium]
MNVGSNKPASSLGGSRRHAALRAFSPLLLVLALSAPPGAAVAQDGDVKTLMDRVTRLQTELTTLQRYIYQGKEPPAELAPGGGSETQAARLEVRLAQLETELRSLTGQIEEQNFKILQFGKRLDKLVADIDVRLQRLEGGAVAPAEQGASAAGEAPAPASAAQGAAAQGETRQVAKLDSGATPEEQYEYAFGLLSRNDYDGAERVLSAFLEQYPADKLAGNAKYWLGETYYVRGRYTEAAITFAEGYESYPDSVKAPDNLLKLGKSLAALGQTEDACGTFAELHARYGSASSTILQQAKNEQKKLSCP